MLSKFKNMLGFSSKPTLESEVNWVFWRYLSLYFGGVFLYNYAFFNNNGHVFSSLLVSFAYAFVVFYPMINKVKKINEKYAQVTDISEPVLCLPDNSKHEMSATFSIIDHVYKNKKQADLLKQSLK